MRIQMHVHGMGRLGSASLELHQRNVKSNFRWDLAGHQRLNALTQMAKILDGTHSMRSIMWALNAWHVPMETFPNVFVKREDVDSIRLVFKFLSRLRSHIVHTGSAREIAAKFENFSSARSLTVCRTPSPIF